MATETQHFSDSDELSEDSNILSDSDNGSDPPSPVTKKRKKTDTPESGDKSLFPSADDTTDTVMSDERVRATKWANWNELCDFKN
eukprot:5984670-Prymnesium_polylepis.1